MFNKENFEKFETREGCIFQVASILYKLYMDLETMNQNYKLYYRPAIKCQNLSNSCGPTTFDSFKEQCMKKDDIISFALSMSCIIGEDKENEYNDWCKVTVIFEDNKEEITINYLKEFENELFDDALINIRDCLKNQKVIFKNLKRKKPIREKIDIGVLGEYLLNEFQTEEYYDTEDGYNRFFKRVMKNYAENIDLINNKIIYKIYDELVATAYPIWEYESFSKIIDEDKLPVGFEDLTDEEKEKIVYKEFDYNEENIIEKLSQNVPFLNINKFKDDIIITNVTINKKPKEISIEFKGLCNFFGAIIVLDYGKSYEVRAFDPS